MSCHKCYSLLQDLKLNCLKHNKLCSEDKLRLELKKSNLSIHPDKNQNDPDANDKFVKYSKCIKYIIENYSCYKEKNTHCNSFTHSYTKGFTTKDTCIKFKKRTNKSSGNCPSGYYIRKGSTRSPKCRFPHKNFRIGKNESVDEAINRLVNDPVINRFYYKIYHSYLKYNIDNTGEYKISKHEIDKVKFFKPLYKCKDFFQLKFPNRTVSINEEIFDATIAKKEYHRLHPELTFEYIQKRHIMMNFRIPKNPKFYTEKKVFIKHIEKHKHFLWTVINRMKNEDIKMPENFSTLPEDLPYNLTCLTYSFNTVADFLNEIDIFKKCFIVEGEKIYFKTNHPMYIDDRPHKLLVKISVKDFVNLNWEEIKKDLYDKTINEYYYSKEYFEKYCQDFTNPPPKQGWRFTTL